MGKYLNMVRQTKEARPSQSPAVERIQTPLSGVIAPGSLITWQGGDGKPRGPATVDFLHTDRDGTVWAFVTYQGTWCAVNTRFVTEAPWRKP